MFRHRVLALRAAFVAGLVVAAAGSALAMARAAPGMAPASAASSGAVAGAAQGAYDQALDRLWAYLTADCGPAPSVRSCDWALRHQYDRLAAGAVVTGGGTSESQHRAVVFAALYAGLTGDETALGGLREYARRVMLPHDGVADPEVAPRPGAPELPVLAHGLVDVDGGARMGDSGTVLGPDTPYLAQERHAGEVPVDPGPDRESYVSAGSFKYASAPDADQWLVDGLELAYALRGDPADRALARRVAGSLGAGLTTAEDFRYGWIEDFEDAPADRWWPYASAPATLTVAAAQPGADGTGAALAMTYTVPWSGFAGLGRDLGQDWRGWDGLSFRFHGDGGGNALRVLLTDPLTPTARLAQEANEHFEHVITDTVAGWRTVELPFDAFRERADWPPDWASTGNGVLDLARVTSLAFEPLPGSFAEDFEAGVAPAWWTYADDGAALAAGPVAPGAGGVGQALGVTYSVASGYAGVGASPNADWTGQAELAFDLQGVASGNEVVVELIERGGERWRHALRDEAAAWRAVTIPLAVSEAGFTPGEWQPDGAEVNGRLDLGGVSDLVFEPVASRFRRDFEDGDAGDWWTYRSDDGSTVAAATSEPGAVGTANALRLEFDVRPDGWAGAGITVEADWRAWDGLELWLKGEGAVRLVLKDADDESYTYDLDRPRPTWTPYRPRWADFDGPVGRGGNRRLDLERVRSLIVERAVEGRATVDLDELAVTGPALGAGRFALDNLRLTGGPTRSGAGVARIDEIRLLGDPGLPTFPNVLPYRLEWDQAGPLPWTGPLYTGYQDPAAFCLAGEAAVARDMVAFLGAAQAAYDTQVTATANAGPFMPLFVQDPAYAGDGTVGWSWDGGLADPNTGWGQFQYRAFAQLAQYFYLSGDSEAGAVLGRFHTWLAAHTDRDEAGRVIGLPLTLVPGTEDLRTGYRAGDFALAAQGLLWVNARTGAAPLRAAARDLLNALVVNQDEAGAFPTDGVRYGYEQAEVGVALALYELLPGGVRPDPFLAALRGSGCQELVRRSIYLPQARAR